MARKHGSRQVNEAEKRLIRIAVQNGTPITQIAAGLGRSRVTIWKQLRAMEAAGEFAQLVLPLGSQGSGNGKK